MNSIADRFQKMIRQEKITCPYCCIFVLLDFSEPTVIDLIEIRKSKCPSCNQVIIEQRQIISDLKKRPLAGYKIETNFGNWSIIFPREKYIVNDNNIPEEIKKDLNKAYSIVDISPDAAATFVRRALQRCLTKYMNMNSNKNLKEQINAAKEKLHPEIFKNLNASRLYGNRGTHPDNNEFEEMIEVNLEEALFSINAVKATVEYWFITRPDQEKMINKIEQESTL